MAANDLMEVHFYLNTFPNGMPATIAIQSDSRVCRLVTAICDGLHILPGHLELYKVPGQLFADNLETTDLSKAIAAFFDNNPQRLTPMRTIASYVDDDPFGFFVIAREFHSDRRPEYTSARAVSAGFRRPSPSIGAKHATVLATQKLSQPDAVFNVRPLDLGQPRVEIWCSAFSDFKHALSLPSTQTEFSPRELDSAFGFMTALLKLYPSKQDRQAALQEERFAGSAMFMGGALPGVRCKTDGYFSVPCQILGESRFLVFYCLQELKNEIGEGGSNPMRQAECDYIALVSSRMYAPLRKVCCCPTLLIGVAGCNLMVSGAVFTNRFICEPLVNVSVGPITTGIHSTHSDLQAEILQLASISRAVDVCLSQLVSFYNALPSEEITAIPSLMPPSETPHFKTFTAQGRTMELEYMSRLEADTTFKAVFKARIKSEPSSLVVVKFAPVYNKKAHTLLEEASLAPKLWFCERVPEVSNWYVIVMSHAVEDFGPVKSNPTAIKALRAAIIRLHGAALVHGDIREPNVLVSQDGVALIDFDWCGEEGEARYPLEILLDERIPWHKEVDRGGLIKKEHDAHMFKQLTGEDL